MLNVRADFREITTSIGVGDGGRGHVPPKIREKYFFRAIITYNSGIFLAKIM